jgi:hypothetical protein
MASLAVFLKNRQNVLIERDLRGSGSGKRDRGKKQAGRQNSHYRKTLQYFTNIR